jgi:hypothetical protein
MLGVRYRIQLEDEEAPTGIALSLLEILLVIIAGFV